MTASPEQLARVADPSTGAAELQSLAAVSPELWPAIAAHPNVYPDLLAWMHANGLPQAPIAPPAPEPLPAAPTVPAPTLPAPTAVLPPATAPVTPAARAEAAAPKAPFKLSKKQLTILGASGGGLVAIILAVVLVLTLIVVPQQRAEAEAAAALTTAIDDFDDAASACDEANSTLARTRGQAEPRLDIDPATLADPSLVAALETALGDTADVEDCVVPTRAETTDEILAQTADLADDAERVKDAHVLLDRASSAVTDSIAAKEQAEAAAAAEAERQRAAAEQAARTWTMTDAQGYSFTASVTVGAPGTSSGVSSVDLGDACGFDPASDIAVPVTLTVTGVTQNFETDISALVTLTQVGRPSTPHQYQIEGYFSEGPACKSTAYGSTVLSGVNWPDSFTAGESSSHRFVVIIRDWKTPATPSGDTAFLSNLSLSVSGGQNSGYNQVSGPRGITLANQLR